MTILGSNWANVLSAPSFWKDILGLFSLSFSFHETQAFIGYEIGFSLKVISRDFL